jgi:hypothetical protein
MYRTPQRPEAPRDDIERIEISRYTKAWRAFALVIAIGMITPIVPIAWMGLADHLLSAGASAVFGLIVLVMTFTLLRDVVAVEANYTQGEVTIIPPRGPQRRVAFRDIEGVDTDSISDSELIRVTLETRAGVVHVLDGMNVDEAVTRIEAMREKAARLAEEAARARSEREGASR